jgi:hypothetical protein
VERERLRVGREDFEANRFRPALFRAIVNGSASFNRPSPLCFDIMNTIVSRLFSPVRAGLAALLLGGCAQTVVTKSSTAPDAGPMHFGKVLVLALVPDDFNRRLVEVAIAEQFTKIPVVVGHQFLPDPTDLKSKEKVLNAVKESGVDGVVVVRLASAGNQFTANTTSQRPMDYQVMSDYYWGSAYDVGAYFDNVSSSFDLTRIFNVETRIFDAKTEKLIWAGETQSKKDSTNDHDYRGLMIEVSNVIKRELKSRDLID